MHFDHGKSKIQISNFWPFPWLCRGSEVTVGSEDQLQNFFKGPFYSGGVKWNTF